MAMTKKPVGQVTPEERNEIQTNSSICRVEQPSKVDSYWCYGRFKRFKA